MSQVPKSTPSSSLGLLSNPSNSISTPSSPTISFSNSNRNISPTNKTILNNNIESKNVEKIDLIAIEQRQQVTENNINQIQIQMNLILNAINKLSNTNIDSNNIDTVAQANNVSEQKQMSEVNAKNNFQSKTISHREQVKEKTIDASKALFDLPTTSYNKIQNFTSAKQNDLQFNNSSFNLNESTIASIDETKLCLDNVSNPNNNNFSFIQQLLPSPSSASQPTLTELLQSGIKATAANNDRTKIKDVHKLLELLTEQAKAIVKVEHDANSCSASEYLIYSLSLMKLLFDFGLNATLEYHFSLMKLVQANEAKLTSQNPLLMLEMMSKYKRLHHTNLLHSSYIYSNNNNNNNNNNKSNNSNNYKSNPRNASYKFTGTPCTFHTKQLGRPANHSDEQCRVAKTKQ